MAFLEESTWRGKVYSGGWVTPAGGEAAVTEPATGAELGRTGIAAPADITRTVQQAGAVQPAWAMLPHSIRSAVLRRAAHIAGARNGAGFREQPVHDRGTGVDHRPKFPAVDHLCGSS